MLWPVVIPSYKRGSKAQTIKLMQTDERMKGKVWLFIYPDDADNYKEAIDSGHFNVRYCEGFRGIVPKRNFINKTMLEEGFENIFVLDDDISALFETYPSHQKKDPSKYKSAKQLKLPFDFFSMMQNKIEVEELKGKHITQTGCIFEFVSVWHDLRTKERLDYYYFPIQLVHLNIKDLKEHNIVYREGYWDDYDLSLQILNNNLLTAEIKDMTYAVEPMNPSNSVSNATRDKWIENSFNLYKTWGNNVHFLIKKGILNAKPVRRNIIKNLEAGRKLDDPIYSENDNAKLKKYYEENLK